MSWGIAGRIIPQAACGACSAGAATEACMCEALKSLSEVKYGNKYLLCAHY